MNTFANKVAAERAVLRIVNRHTPGSRQLAGLSWVAIETWQQTIGLAASDPLVAELKELSDLCQRLSDRSHETFEKTRPDACPGNRPATQFAGKAGARSYRQSPTGRGDLRLDAMAA